VWSCEGHHVRWWEGPYRGETKLGNLVLLCWHHHHLLHKDHGWELHLAADTRRLSVQYRGRPIGATDPPGRRRRTEPVCAPATPTTARASGATADATAADRQRALFDAAPASTN
jgi:hypothetical protein